MTGKKRRYSLLMTLPYGWKLHERKNSVGSGFPDETPCGGCGMLFVFQPPRKACLWMKDTKIPLQAFFLDSKAELLTR